MRNIQSALICQQPSPLILGICPLTTGLRFGFVLSLAPFKVSCLITTGLVCRHSFSSQLAWNSISMVSIFRTLLFKSKALLFLWSFPGIAWNPIIFSSPPLSFSIFSSPLPALFWWFVNFLLHTQLPHTYIPLSQLLTYPILI